MAQRQHGSKGSSVARIEQLAQKLADEMGFELVEASLQREARGKCLCVFIDKEGGISLDDCEKYHKLLQPQFEDIDYDIMEVSSPGVDRPIKTQRDFEKNHGNMVEVHLFAAQNGSKVFQGTLEDFNAETVAIMAGEEKLEFDRKVVSIIKPVIELCEEDFDDVEFNEAQQIEAQENAENEE